MGATKRQLEKEEEYRGMAFNVLTMIGAIKSCELHDDYFYNTYSFDEQGVYAIATAKAKEEYGETSIDFKQLHEAIHDIFNEAADGADSCPYCEKINRE